MPVKYCKICTVLPLDFTKQSKLYMNSVAKLNKYNVLTGY